MKVTRCSLAVGALLSLLVVAPAIAEEEKKDEKKWDVNAPQGEFETVTIDTTETTWSNVDVSPDGNTLLFDMLGDIYSVPIEGGTSTPITSGIAWSYQPRYSPDGTQIAFISDREGGDNLWVMNADGSEPRALTKEKDNLVHTPVWSPDGDYLATMKGFTSTRSIAAGEIWMYHVGGGSGLQLTERPNGKRDQKSMGEPAFSVDGRYVYFSQDTTPGRVWQYNKDSTGQIFVIQRFDRETGEIETAVSGPGGAVRPTPSPDGRYLAFVRRLPGLTSAIFLKDLESGKETPVYTSFERDLQESSGTEGNAPAIAWTPDANSIVFWTDGEFWSVDVESLEVTHIPVRTTIEKQIQTALRFPVDVAPSTLPIRMPRWVQYSPDGSKVVFQALGHLYVRDATGGAPRRLTTQNNHFEFYPAISPDGRQVAYTTWNDQELGSVRVVSIDGGEGSFVIEEPGHFVEPRFSPDGDSLVYRKISGGFLLSPLWSLDPGIYVVPTTGGEATRISTSGRNPHFDADGERVFFSTRADGTELALKSVDLSGQEERTHLQGAKTTEFSVSPDGRWVAFTEQFDAYVAPLARTGKKVTIGSSSKAFPVKQVSKRAGEFLHWSADSDQLHWAHGASLYSRRLADAFEFLDGAPDELPEPVAEGLDISFTIDADVPSGTIAITGARIVTMRGAREGEQEIIENGTLVVEGNRIAAVGPAAEVEVPEGAFVVDATGKTIIPGLIDVHAHGAMARSEITPQQNWQQYSNLAFGVTTIHDPSNDTSSIFSAAEMQRAGMIVGPRIFSTGTILYGAHLPGITAAIDSYEDALFHVQRLKDVGAISVKSYQQPRRDQKQQVIAAGRELGIMVVPEGGMKFQHNMTEIVDGHTGIATPATRPRWGSRSAVSPARTSGTSTPTSGRTSV
jgi:Tol biopolymer transport system component